MTVNPDYPESSTVLAHGVTTRKRKKQNYEYLKDEVKVQRNGLFPHFSEKMFQIKQTIGEKFSIESLLKEIPELMTFFQRWEKQTNVLKIKKAGDEFIIPTEIPEFFNMDIEVFQNHMKQVNNTISLSFEEINNGTFKVRLNGQKNTCREIVPFRYHIKDQLLYFLKNKMKKNLSFFPELLIHYLVLYHLSMLARYEIEWWSEILHQKHSIEYPLIIHYLSISLQKIPILINQFLFLAT